MGECRGTCSVLTALTADGWQSLPIQASLGTPLVPSGGLSLVVSVPSDCTTGEGRTREVLDFDLLAEGLRSLGPGLPPDREFNEERDALWNSPEVHRRVREGVESFTLTWGVSGGTPPYRLSFHDVLSFHGVEASGASGSAEVTCAREGVNLDDLDDPDVQVVEEGSKTIVVTATDFAGTAATTATAVVEIIKDIREDEYGAVISSGSTHRSGYYYAPVPEGMQIVYEGLLDGLLAVPPTKGVSSDFVPSRFVYRQVTDGPRATAAHMDTVTGEEVERYVVMLTTVNGRTKWSEQPNLELTSEENALWDQYFNSLSYLSLSTAAKINWTYEAIRVVMHGLEETYKEFGIDEEIEFHYPLSRSYPYNSARISD